MMNILELLNINSGAIIAIATIFLVVATAYLSYFNQKMWIVRDKPFLIFENIVTDKFVENPIDEYDFLQNIYINNIGKGHAFKIKFVFTHLNGETDEYSFNFLQSQSKVFLSTQEYLKFKISEISYEDINGIPTSQTPYTAWSNKHRVIPRLQKSKKT